MNLANRLNGKVALVTGAAAGIGRASVMRMAAEGAQVIATDMDEAVLRTLATNERIRSHRLDVTDSASVRSAAELFPEVDVLFNCAGIVRTGSIVECSPADWAATLAVNVTSCFEMMNAFLPGMLQKARGSIINMASIVSSMKGAPNRFAYGTSKAAVIGMTKSVAADFVGRGIRCNAICPGTVDTPSLQQRLHATGNYAKARQEFEARQPMGRLATVHEICGLVAFLASDEASFITGQAYAVDGGWSI